MSTQTVILNCKYCNSNFIKLKKEYDRQIRRGRTDFFCNLGCSVKYNNIHSTFLEDGRKHWFKPGNTSHKKGALYEFNRFIRSAKKRTKDKNYFLMDLNVEYLKELWDKQNGKCAYTGIQLKLDKSFSHIILASLDRIDSTKGYIKDNVQFVSTSINLAKNSMSDLEFKKGLKILFDSYKEVKTQLNY